VTKSGSN